MPAQNAALSSALSRVARFPVPESVTTSGVIDNYHDAYGDDPYVDSPYDDYHDNEPDDD